MFVGFALTLAPLGALAFTGSVLNVARTSESKINMAAATMSKFDKLRFKHLGLRPEDKLEDDADGFSYAEFESTLDSNLKSLNRGDTCSGTILMYEPKGCLVDIGVKASAYLPLGELSLIKVDRPEDGVALGETYEFEIISDEDENGQVTISKRRLEYAAAWEKVVKLQAEDTTFDSEVISINRGGALVLVEGLRAFLPGSHMVGGTPTEELIGRTVQLKLLDVDKETNRLVVSNRRALVEKQMSDLSPGKVVEGTVRGVKPYGVFVDIGGMSGLLHISQISCDHIDDLNTVLPVGMSIKCMIINRDQAKGRIALSTKTLEPEPGDMLRNPQLVYDQAEQTAAAYQERIEAERKAREEAAQDVIFGLESVFNIASDEGEGEEKKPAEDVPFEV